MATMILEIHPHEGVGALRFGLAAADIRRRIGAPYTPVRMPPGAASPADAFDSLGIYAHYDRQGRCTAIEVFPPSEPFFMGRSIIGQPLSQVRAWMELLDPGVHVTGAGVTSFELGFGIYALEAPRRLDAPVERVVVFSPRYPDEMTTHPR